MSLSFLDLNQPSLTLVLLALPLLGLIFTTFKEAQTRQRLDQIEQQRLAAESLGQNDSTKPVEGADGYPHDREMTVPFEIGDVAVTKILVHPIKSCRGISVQEWKYTPEGLEFDRNWCIIEADTHTILTAREVAKMVLITPRIEHDESSPFGGTLVVSFPPESNCEPFYVPLRPTADVLQSWEIIRDCTMFARIVVDGYVCASHPGIQSTRSPSAILSDYFGRPVHLVMKGPQPRHCPPTLAFPALKATSVYQDTFPFMMVSEESLGEVTRVVNGYARGEAGQETIGGMDRSAWRDGALEIERFRPNIVLKGAGVPFAEDTWRRVAVGPSATEFSLVSKCTRCLLPNVSTSTGVRDAAVPFKVLLKFRTKKDPARPAKACFGCNAVVDVSGVVSVGDKVKVLEWAGEGGV